MTDAEHDRDCRGGSLGRKRTFTDGRGDHGHATADKIGHEGRQAVVLAVQPVVLDHHVLALDGAGFVEAFTERSGLAHGGLGRPAADKADHRQCRLLRTRRERPRSCCAAQCEYEFSPSDVDCHATPPAGGRVHAIEGTISRFSEGTNNTFALRKS